MLTHRGSSVVLDRMLYTFTALLFVFLPVSRGGMNIFVGLTAVTLVIKLAFARDLSRIAKSNPVPILSLLMAALLSIIGSPNWVLSIDEFIFVWLKYIIVYFAVIESVSTKKREWQLNWILFAGGFVNSSYAVYQHWLAPYSRVSAFLENPNSAGTYLAIASLLSLSLFTVTRRTCLRILLLMSAVMGTVGVFFTMSRGALLGLFVALTVLAVLGARLENNKEVIILLLIGLTAIAILMPESVVRRFELAVNLQDDSSLQRIYLFSSAWRMFRESFLIGKGIGAFRVLYPRYKPDGAIDLKHPHNIYLHIMAEMGTLGAAAAAWCITTLARKCIYNIRYGNRGELYRASSLAVLLIGIMLAIHGFVDETIRSHMVGLTSMALFALVMKGDLGQTSNVK